MRSFNWATNALRLLTLGMLLVISTHCKQSTSSDLQSDVGSGIPAACQSKKANLDGLKAMLASFPDASTPEARSRLNGECSASGAYWNTGSTDANAGCTCTNVTGAATVRYPYKDNYARTCGGNNTSNVPDASTAEGRSLLDKVCSGAGGYWTTGSTDANSGCTCTNVRGSPTVRYPYETNYGPVCGGKANLPDLSTADARSLLSKECGAAGASWATGSTDANNACFCTNVQGAAAIAYPYNDANYRAACKSNTKSDTYDKIDTGNEPGYALTNEFGLTGDQDGPTFPLDTEEVEDKGAPQDRATLEQAIAKAERELAECIKLSSNSSTPATQQVEAFKTACTASNGTARADVGFSGGQVCSCTSRQAEQAISGWIDGGSKPSVFQNCPAVNASSPTSEQIEAFQQQCSTVGAAQAESGQQGGHACKCRANSSSFSIGGWLSGGGMSDPNYLKQACFGRVSGEYQRLCLDAGGFPTGEKSCLCNDGGTEYGDAGMQYLKPGACNVSLSKACERVRGQAQSDGCRCSGVVLKDLSELQGKTCQSTATPTVTRSPVGTATAAPSGKTCYLMDVCSADKRTRWCALYDANRQLINSYLNRRCDERAGPGESMAPADYLRKLGTERGCPQIQNAPTNC